MWVRGCMLIVALSLCATPSAAAADRTAHEKIKHEVMRIFRDLGADDPAKVEKARSAFRTYRVTKRKYAQFKYPQIREFITVDAPEVERKVGLFGGVLTWVGRGNEEERKQLDAAWLEYRRFAVDANPRVREIALYYMARSNFVHARDLSTAMIGCRDESAAVRSQAFRLAARILEGPRWSLQDEHRAELRELVLRACRDDRDVEPSALYLCAMEFEAEARETVSLLIEGMHDATPEFDPKGPIVGTLAAFALARIDSSPATIKRVVAELKKGDPTFEYTALDYFWVMPIDHVALCPELIACFDAWLRSPDSDADRLQRVLVILLNTECKSLHAVALERAEQLMMFYEGYDARIDQLAQLVLLFSAAHPEARKTIDVFLRHPDPAVRYRVVEAIGEGQCGINFFSAIYLPTLRRVAHNDSDAEVRSKARWAIERVVEEVPTP